MKTQILLSTLLSIVLYSTVVAQSSETEGSTTVKIEGLVEHTKTYSLEDLKKMEGVSGKDFEVSMPNGMVKNTIQTYKGVLLKTLLEEAKIEMKQSKDRGKYYILVKATDDYQTLFSWNELFSSNTGEQVYLLYEENGKPIEEDGPLVLICASDKVTGPRHVKWVESIEVRKVD